MSAAFRAPLLPPGKFVFFCIAAQYAARASTVSCVSQPFPGWHVGRQRDGDSFSCKSFPASCHLLHRWPAFTTPILRTLRWPTVQNHVEQEHVAAGTPGNSAPFTSRVRGGTGRTSSISAGARSMGEQDDGFCGKQRQQMQGCELATSMSSSRSSSSIDSNDGVNGGPIADVGRAGERGGPLRRSGLRRGGVLHAREHPREIALGVLANDVLARLRLGFGAPRLAC